MKTLSWLLAVFFVVPLLFLVIGYGASELGGEVVTLDRANRDGSESRVRIWIVDTGKAAEALVEHGAADAFWIAQLVENPVVVLTRGGKTARYLASADKAAHQQYHDLRTKKYGWADTVATLMTGGEDCEGVPVRLASMAAFSSR